MLHGQRVYHTKLAAIKDWCSGWRRDGIFKRRAALWEKAVDSAPSAAYNL
jgi:hypothetical protein